MTVDDDGVHLDEGTIHAWLDGALDAAERARIQAHVGQCGACASRVAEARGLVAGASRVIGMLDETPAPLVRPAVTPPAGTDLSMWRLLRVTPARASIAATLVVAVGIALTRGQLSHDVPTPTRVQDTALAMSAAPAPAAATTAPLRTDSILSSAIARRIAEEAPPRTMERAPGVAVPAAPAPGSPAPNADLANAESKIAAGRASVASERVMSPPGADRTRAGVGQRMMKEVVTTGMAASAAKAADAAGNGAQSMGVVASDAIVAGQCYLVESATPAVWGSVHLPMVVAMDSTGQQARVLTPNGQDTEARAYLQYNGSDSALFRLRRIGFSGTMTLLAASETRTGTLTSSSAQHLSEIIVTSPPRVRARASAPASAPAAAQPSTAQASITARRVACPPTQ